jgi:hypothetical protein
VRVLRDEVAGFLLEHGPSTSSQIAAGVRARRNSVDEELLAGPFVVAPTPEGANHRARHWVGLPVASCRVPSGQGRAAAMLGVLRDGRKHSRVEIFKAAGRFFLTNNAASELRAKGYDVRHGRDGGLDVYWLASPATSVIRARRGSTLAQPRIVDVERAAA